MKNTLNDKPNRKWLRSGISILGILCIAVTAHTQIADPIPDPIQPADFTLQLRELVKFPSTSSTAPKARINMLREVDDGSGRLFVNDLNGLMYSVVDGEWDLYLHIRSQFDDFISVPGKGTGFGAFAFHPDFRTNGIFYTSHAEESGAAPADFSPAEFDNIALQWVVYEWIADDPSAQRFEGTRREVIRADFPDVLHGFQDITFNPTATPGDGDYGMLYICIGDGGSSKNFQMGNLTHPFSYLGTIFRIDPLGNNSANEAYGIPEDNPFTGMQNATEEIWTMGFRNPHRICWDPGSDHKMLIGDIGEMNIEEVNIGKPGNHYGWSEREGTFLYDRPSGRENVYPLPPDDSLAGYTYPVAMYDHDEGFAIVGGYVYRSTTIPEFTDKYIFGDIVNGRIFVVDADSLEEGSWQMPQEVFLTDSVGNSIDLQDLEDNGRADLRFGTDLSGNIYVLTKADGVVRTTHSNITSSIRDARSVSRLQVYPNPARSKLYFHGEVDYNDFQSASIYDMLGRAIVQTFDPLVAQNGMSVSQLTSGSYVLRVETGSGSYVAPVVIQD